MIIFFIYFYLKSLVEYVINVLKFALFNSQNMIFPNLINLISNYSKRIDEVFEKIE